MSEFNTASLTDRNTAALNEDLKSWVYNGLDCCVTLEVYEELMKELAGEPQNIKDIYQFALDKSAPFLEMSLRGIYVDPAAKEEAIAHLDKQVQALKARFTRLTVGLFGYPISPTSPHQVKSLFYEILGINPIKKRNSKGVYAPTVDEAALDKLRFNFWATPFVNYILAIRELSKKLSFLRTDIDEDGRFRTSLNIAGTTTGRSSSSASDFGTGSNLQNIDTTLRYPFVADEGMILVNVDLEQADARNVGALIWNMFPDDPRAGQYLDACESGDVHTMVCKMAYPELGWPDDPKQWKSFCDDPSQSGYFHGTDSYRQGAKKLGHATNYLGQPRALASRVHMPQKIVEAFQERYFSAFPMIPLWQKETIRMVQEEGFITTPYGRRRYFFGRGSEPDTWREAIAYAGQSMTGHQIDMGILQLWRARPEVQLLIQVHDSILFQVPRAVLEEAMPDYMRLLRFTFELARGRKFFVPLEAKTGWNWGNKEIDKKTGEVRNPWGLSKWTGKETREPPRRGPKSINRLIG